MTNKNSRFDRWADLDKDILVRIFMTLNVVELICGASVSKSWREATSEPYLWEIVDLSKLEAKNFNRELGQSNQRVMDIVNSVFSLSGGTIFCLTFHFYAYITSQHLVCISERTRNLKRLVLPVWDNNILVNDFEEAAKNWPYLESLTISGFVGTAAIVIKHGDDSNCTSGDDNNSISIVVVTKAYLVECS
ncbi:F-box/LRR-repeat protein At3g48880-like [Rosa chinensis]|uniref:F-box/LRR-repeat protein At3g48880-like n=1 Tax=Rosa chinensis TaxID=74649 RepID=UPI000D0920E5|nr:F-box/LRR-repeat protein At3g48880-like [Rosa chinensis]